MDWVTYQFIVLRPAAKLKNQVDFPTTLGAGTLVVIRVKGGKPRSSHVNDRARTKLLRTPPISAPVRSSARRIVYEGMNCMDEHVRPWYKEFAQGTGTPRSS